MCLISSGKTETALDGRRISRFILILKFCRQHQPQRLHEKPESRISGMKVEELIWIRRSIPRRREDVSMNEHHESMDIKAFENLYSSYDFKREQEGKRRKACKS